MGAGLGEPESVQGSTTGFTRDVFFPGILPPIRLWGAQAIIGSVVRITDAGGNLTGLKACPHHLKNFPFLFLLIPEREGRDKERERNTSAKEKHQSAASCTCLPRYNTCNPGMCPDGERNPQPFSMQDDAQPSEPHRSGAWLHHLLLSNPG